MCLLLLGLFLMCDVVLYVCCFVCWCCCYLSVVVVCLFAVGGRVCLLLCCVVFCVCLCVLAATDVCRVILRCLFLLFVCVAC